MTFWSLIEFKMILISLDEAWECKSLISSKNDCVESNDLSVCIYDLSIILFIFIMINFIKH